MESISEINTAIPEGRLLMTALVILSVSPDLHIDKKDVDGRLLHPDVLLGMVERAALKMYPPLPADIKPAEKTFESEISSAINIYSKENGSNTPDFILAKYLTRCLEAFDECSMRREKWYGKSLSII